MPTPSKTQAVAALQHLLDVAVERQSKLQNFSAEAVYDSSDEEASADSLIFDPFFNAGGLKSIRRLTHFEAKEFLFV